jgi:hypothetical protein
METPLLKRTLVADLPGVFGKVYAPPPDGKAVLSQAGALRELDPGQRQSVAGLWPSLWDSYGGDWVGVMPAGPIPVIVQIPLNANDQLVDATFFLLATISSPMAFAAWAARFPGGSPTSADLRQVVQEDIEPALRAVAARYGLADLQAAAQGEIRHHPLWAEALGKLALRKTEWGLSFAPAPNGLLLNSAATRVVEAKRLAELQRQLAEIELDKAMSEEERRVKLLDFKRQIGADFGDQTAEAVFSSAAPGPTEAAAPAKPAKAEAVAGVLAQLAAATAGRADRALRRRVNDVLGALKADLQPAPEKPAAPAARPTPPGTPGWERWLIAARVLAVLATIGFSAYLAWQIIRGEKPDTLIEYLRSLAGAAGSFLIALGGIPALGRRLRLRDRAAAALELVPAAELDAAEPVWSLADREDYDNKVRGQALRQFEQIARDMEDARRDAGRASQFDEAVSFKRLAERATLISTRLANGEIGKAAYLMDRKLGEVEFGKMLDRDGIVVARMAAAVELAGEARKPGSAGAEARARLDSALQAAQEALNRRSDQLM